MVQPIFTEQFAPAARGASGKIYPTLAAAIAGEIVASSVSFNSGSGHGQGRLVGASPLVQTDDLYNGRILIYNGATPSFPLIYRYGRITDYVGSTRNVYYDRSWISGSVDPCIIVEPKKITLLRDVTENISITTDVEINLAGNTIHGQVDISGGEFCRLHGGGTITQGVEKTNAGILILEGLNVSRRGQTFYAVLLTNGSNIGRLEAYDCNFGGVVASRRGYFGAIIRNCTNDGVPENSGACAYRLVESISGVSITMVRLDVALDSEYGGAIFYSENSITGNWQGSIRGHIRTPMDPLGTQHIPSSTEDFNTRFSIYRAVGAGVITGTGSAGGCVLTVGGTDLQATESVTVDYAAIAVVSVQNFTGNVSANPGTVIITATGGCKFAKIEVWGDTDCSGTITYAGALKLSMGVGRYATVELASTLTGTITDSGENDISGGGQRVEDIHCLIRFMAVQDTGSPSVTLSGLHRFETNCYFNAFSNITSSDVSVGTWAMNQSTYIDGLLSESIITLEQGEVAGGTFSMFGGTFRIAPSNSTIDLFNHEGTGGTLNITGDVKILGTGAHFSTDMTLLAKRSGAGGTITLSNNVEFFVENFGIGTLKLVELTQSGAAVTFGSGNEFFMRNLRMLSCALFQVTAGTLTIGSNVVIEFKSCLLEGEINDVLTGGTFTVTADTELIRFHEVTFNGVVDFDRGQDIGELQFWNCSLNGLDNNNCLTVAGGRPTTFRMWNCNYVGKVEQNPEIIFDHTVLPADGSQAAGNLQTIVSSGEADDAAAGSVVDGVLLNAAGFAGDEAILVRAGRTFVKSDGSVARGDSLILDTGTPTQVTTGSPVLGQTVGKALEADGTTFSGRTYAEISLR